MENKLEKEVEIYKENLEILQQKIQTQLQLLVNVYNTANEIEVKGIENVEKVFGIMQTIRQYIEEEKANTTAEEVM